MARISPQDQLSNAVGGADPGTAQMSELEFRVVHLERAVASQRAIGIAIGLLAQRYGCTSDQAWLQLRDLSSRTNTKVREVARILRDAFDGDLQDGDAELLTAIAGLLPEGTGAPSGDPRGGDSGRRLTVTSPTSPSIGERWFDMAVGEGKLSESLRRLAGAAEDHDVFAALREVTLACVDLFGVAGSGIMIADEQDITRYVSASDGPGRYLEEAESRTGEGVCTVAFVENRVVDSSDVAADARWPRLAEALAGRGIHAVLGVPVRLGGVPVGTLDVYRQSAHDWDESERRALSRYGEVVATTLTAALRAHTAGELAAQLEYALEYRVIIERAVGFLMAQGGVGAVDAFNRLRQVARARRTKIGQIAEELLATGRLPAHR